MVEAWRKGTIAMKMTLPFALGLAGILLVGVAAFTGRQAALMHEGGAPLEASAAERAGHAISRPSAPELAHVRRVGVTPDEAATPAAHDFVTVCLSDPALRPALRAALSDEDGKGPSAQELAVLEDGLALVLAKLWARHERLASGAGTRAEGLLLGPPGDVLFALLPDLAQEIAAHRIGLRLRAHGSGRYEGSYAFDSQGQVLRVDCELGGQTLELSIPRTVVDRLVWARMQEGFVRLALAPGLRKEAGR